MNQSIQSQSDAALLATLVGTRTAANVLRLSQGSLSRLLLDDPSPLPLPEAVTRTLQSTRELVRRALAEAMRAGDVLASPNNVRDYLKLNFAHQQYESFVVLFVDAQNRVLACEEMFRGTLTQTAVYPREVVKRALAVNAAAVILAHNHPSGLAEPSFADNTLTRSLANALSMVDVRVLDHLIVAGNTVLSYAERGLL
jgi:DNA repair protein RadC